MEPASRLFNANELKRVELKPAEPKPEGGVRDLAQQVKGAVNDILGNKVGEAVGEIPMANKRDLGPVPGEMGGGLAVDLEDLKKKPEVGEDPNMLDTEDDDLKNNYQGGYQALLEVELKNQPGKTAAGILRGFAKDLLDNIGKRCGHDEKWGQDTFVVLRPSSLKNGFQAMTYYEEIKGKMELKNMLIKVRNDGYIDLYDTPKVPGDPSTAEPMEGLIGLNLVDVLQRLGKKALAPPPESDAKDYIDKKLAKEKKVDPYGAMFNAGNIRYYDIERKEG